MGLGRIVDDWWHNLFTHLITSISDKVLKQLHCLGLSCRSSCPCYWTVVYRKHVSHTLTSRRKQPDAFRSALRCRHFATSDCFVISYWLGSAAGLVWTRAIERPRVGFSKGSAWRSTGYALRCVIYFLLPQFYSSYVWLRFMSGEKITSQTERAGKLTGRIVISPFYYANFWYEIRLVCLFCLYLKSRHL
jgi:hypothetical protein